MAAITVHCPDCDGDLVYEVECEPRTWEDPGGCTSDLMVKDCDCALSEEQLDRMADIAIEVYSEPRDPC